LAYSHFGARTEDRKNRHAYSPTFFATARFGCGTNENGIGKSRYIYPGNSGMGNADGFPYYLKNLPGIAFYETILGLVSGAFGLLFRVGTRNPSRTESAQGGRIAPATPPTPPSTPV
jgi:hypothetical protein